MGILPMGHGQDARATANAFRVFAFETSNSPSLVTLNDSENA